MASEHTKHICQRAGAAFAELQSDLHLIRECYAFLLPYRSAYDHQTQGQGTTSRPYLQYDSMPQQAAVNFVNRMTENFTPVFTNWFKLVPGSSIKVDLRDAALEIMEEATTRIFEYLHSSNFSTAISGTHWGLGVGTGNLFLYEGDEQHPFNFVSVPPERIALSLGNQGTVDGKFMRHMVKINTLRHLCPGHKISLPSELSSQVDDKEQGETRVQILEAFTYNKDTFTWHHSIIYEASAHELISKPLAEEMCFTPRWFSTPGRSFAIGPFILALADIKTKNSVRKSFLQQLALTGAPAFMVKSTGGVNTNIFKVRPGSVIPVESTGGPTGASLVPIPTPGNFGAQQYQDEELRQSIDKALLSGRLQAPQASPSTAYEIAQRIREFQQDAGATYGRVFFELAQPMVKRMVGILARRRLIRWPSNLRIDNFGARVQVVSRISQTQDIEELNQAVQAFEMLRSVDPALALQKFNLGRLAKLIVENSGAPHSILNTDLEEEQVLELTAARLAQIKLESEQGGTPQ